ncbi:hypothetical protein EJB05_15490 [Eragrostis curvula]|uniref:Uncharacterized protein n=1 Tax=Eragrostis curvula TaxID=38414 RepID=A0A5J9W3N2_9POAL|nr:hypothetical protein EJB05_15490 [Eragrostis curvula]
MTTAPVLYLSSAPDECLLRVPQRILRDDLGIIQERNATINYRRTTPSRSNHLISFSGKPVPQPPCVQHVPEHYAYSCGNLVKHQGCLHGVVLGEVLVLLMFILGEYYLGDALS